jgi:hypothetical protein
VGVGCFCATNVYSDGAVDWVTVERERLILAWLERGVFGGYVRIYGICVFICLSVSDDHRRKCGTRNDCGRDCCPVGECWSYCESCIDAGDQSSGYIFKSLC